MATAGEGGSVFKGLQRLIIKIKNKKEVKRVTLISDSCGKILQFLPSSSGLISQRNRRFPEGVSHQRTLCWLRPGEASSVLSLGWPCGAVDRAPAQESGRPGVGSW